MLTWNIETVDSTGHVGSFSSLALDSSGNPHISYYSYTNADLKYAVAAVSGMYWMMFSGLKSRLRLPDSICLNSFFWTFDAW